MRFSDVDSRGGQIKTEQKKIYTKCQKIIFCRCCYCMQQDEILTSKTRTQTIQKIIHNYINNLHHYESLKLIILMYLNQENENLKKYMYKCKILPNLQIFSYRTDLQFYIPQITNYIVFFKNLKNNQILSTIQIICKNYYLTAHLFYFYLNSIEKIIDDNHIQIFKSITVYKNIFIEQISQNSSNKHLNCFDFLEGNCRRTIVKANQTKQKIINLYGTSQQIETKDQIKALQIQLPIYTSIFNQNTIEQKNQLQSDTKDKKINSFMGQIDFFEDLIRIAHELCNFKDKKQKLKQFLQQINCKLPCNVYIPFSRSKRLVNARVISTVQQSHIFSTKSRNPYLITVEVYCPIDALQEEQREKFWYKTTVPITLENIINQTDQNLQNHRGNRYTFQQSNNPNNYNLPNNNNIPIISSLQHELARERNSLPIQLKFKQHKLNINKIEKQQQIEMKTNIFKMQQCLKQFFGQSQQQIKTRIRKQSIFSQVNSWNLLHLIIKIDDNLKQQQFALQLVLQFDYIFKLQNLPLIVTSYQVISLGADYGIIEMVKDTITIDHLKKKLNNFEGKNYTLKQFFQTYFCSNINEAKDNFLKSLVAYSLVMYFLQVKDRHNGNILLHRTGKIFHIDFGFFLSNSPGKGIQLENLCPFKLLTQYIEILDGANSYYFQKFRQYFFLGFKAILKHQNKITILVKMMYSSIGTSMPCFQKGQQTIIEMQKRFNPSNFKNDMQLNLHCQSLVDKSLDNWRAQWYDRWQYIAQGIFY